MGNMLRCRPLHDGGNIKIYVGLLGINKIVYKTMDLFCEKYNESIPAEKAFCNHPKEYCKFRTACIIHFMGDENISSDSEEVSTEEDSMLTLQFDKGNGLLPAIVQDYETKEVLMLAYVNDLAWKKTLETGKAH